MSALYSFAAALANQLPRGFKQVLVFNSASDTGWSSLGEIRNGSLSVASVSSANTYGMEFPFAAIVKGSFDMMQCTTTEIQLLGALCAGNIDIAVLGVDGKYYYSFNLTPITPSIMAKVNAAGNITKDRFIHVMFQYGVTASQIWSGSAGSTGIFPQSPTPLAPATTDAFWSIANTGILVTNLGKPGNIKPAGLTSASIEGAFESAQYQILGRTRGTTLTAEIIADTETDELDRQNIIGADIQGQFDMQQTSQATGGEVSQLPTMFTAGAQFKLIQTDGLTWTITQSGVSFDYQNIGDFNGLKILRVKLGGKVPISSFNGIFS